MNRLLYKLDYKYRKYAIENLMKYISISMLVVFVMDIILISSGVIEESLYSLLYFDSAKILQGEFWRIISFVILYPDTGTVFMLLSIYFYYFLGSALESSWGSFRFGVYYFAGVVGSIISGIIFGQTTNYYLNMSLFFAFAVLYPDTEFRIFFVLPVKAKILAYIDAGFFVYSFIFSDLAHKAALLFAVGNFFLFFYTDIIDWFKHIISKSKHR